MRINFFYKLNNCFIFALATLVVSLNVVTFATEPAIIEDKCVNIVASFEEGIDRPWNPGAGQYAPHYWTSVEPSYSYEPADSSGWWKEINYAWTPQMPDNVNWWHTLGPKNGTWGYTDCTYKLYLDGLNNYDDWSIYTDMVIDWFGARSNQTSSNLDVFAYTGATSRWENLDWLIGTDGVRYQNMLSLSGLSQAEKQNMRYVLFRVYNGGLPSGNDDDNWQRTHLYSVKVKTDTPPSMTESGYGYTFNSKFLGSVFHRRYGSYSACGFWDDTVSKYKIWFGGGIPEVSSSDGVWYIETDSMAPGVERLNPIRINMTGISGVLKPYNSAPGYGGDPTVIKFEGDPSDDLYIMYFSGLSVSNSWNQIYRAVSTDGLNFTLNPTTPVVAAAGGGAAGYGSGSPSVVYRNGVFYMYYYSQWDQPTKGTLYLRTSTDSVNFGSWTEVSMSGYQSISAMDVKYVSSLGLWVGSPEIEPIGVFTAISTDGLTWNLLNLAQAPLTVDYHNNNAGIIAGNGLGVLDSGDMYITYGNSEKPYCEAEYYTRQLEYSSWHID